MTPNQIKVFLLTLVSLPFLTGCYAVIGNRHPAPNPPPNRARNVCSPGGPPPWAPAHGRRRKCQYRYYPRVEIYYSIGADVYFWQEDGEWHSGDSLPRWISIEGAESVELELKTNKPYEKHQKIKQQYGPKNGGPGSPGKGKGGPPEHAGRGKDKDKGPPWK